MSDVKIVRLQTGEDVISKVEKDTDLSFNDDAEAEEMLGQYVERVNKYYRGPKKHFEKSGSNIYKPAA